MIVVVHDVDKNTAALLNLGRVEYATKISDGEWLVEIGGRSRKIRMDEDLALVDLTAAGVLKDYRVIA
jgi:hypothetical protein